MRRHRGLVVAAIVLALVAVGFGVHAAHAPSVEATTADAWHPVARAPLSPRVDAIVAAVGSSVLVFGGERYMECPLGASCPYPGDRRDGAVYHPRSDTWTTMARAPRYVTNGPWAVDGHLLLMLTGRDRLVTYDVTANAWSALPAPPVPLRGNDVLAAGGGYAYASDDAVPTSGPLHRVERVNLATGRWDLLPPSTNTPRMYLRRLLLSPDGLLMVGLNPYRSDTRVQAEILDHGHWHRFGAPSLHADFYTFTWTGKALAVAFPTGGGSGQSLDAGNGRWAPLAAQPDAYQGSAGWWENTYAASGSRILKLGEVFDTATGRTLRLTQPHTSGPGVSAGLAGRRAYVMDSSSRLWWQLVA
jgi:hypothetical protein